MFSINDAFQIFWKYSFAFLSLISITLPAVLIFIRSIKVFVSNSRKNGVEPKE